MKFYSKFSSILKKYFLITGVIMFLVVPGVVKCAGSVDVPNNSNSSSTDLGL